MLNQKFGRLTVIKYLDTINSHKMVLCKCDCGTFKQVRISALLYHHKPTRSCGCARKETIRKQAKHMMSFHPIYKIWNQMIRRCEYPKHHKYMSYGFRGITVCDRWHKFENFYADMGDKPSPKYSLERIDNNKGYSPDNCKWATIKEQQNNTRRNRLLSFNGQCKNAKQWSEHLGISYQTLQKRLRVGWPIEKTLTTPIDIRFRNSLTK